MSLNSWQTCLQHLERELPADDFNTWVGPLQIRSGKGRTVLLAPNEYVRDYIALNYLERIRDIFEHLGSTRESVVVDISRHHDLAVPQTAAPVPRTRAQSGLDKRYRFSNFVLGKSNELACAAAQQVAKKPGALTTPAALYGGTGLGKTHLLHAAGNLIASGITKPRCSICTRSSSSAK
jgi:chromosomal replication initiator protein